MNNGELRSILLISIKHYIMISLKLRKNNLPIILLRKHMLDIFIDEKKVSKIHIADVNQVSGELRLMIAPS